MRDAQPNDSLFFHCWSGHHVWAQTVTDLYLVSGRGGQVPHKDGDEDDGYDEGLKFLPILSLPTTKPL